MYQVQEWLKNPSGSSDSGCDWRFELRVGYLPLDMTDVFEKDPLTFTSYYDQVVNEYLNKNFDSLDQEIAIQLGCLQIRRIFKDMPGNALDKKSNLEYLEKEVGLQKFFPKIVTENNKPKNMRKLIQQHFKKFSNCSERECMFKFLELLKSLYKYDQERFRCTTGKTSFTVIHI